MQQMSGWTHYKCTQLPVYQLYLIVRRYTCEACANVTPDFRENIQRNSHAPNYKLGTRNWYRELSEFDIETFNCFSPLSDADESLNEQLQQNSDNKRAKSY